jgi:peptidoglycan/xylan/chitin deacetylase (PgdA/CDA1 family)
MTWTKKPEGQSYDDSGIKSQLQNKSDKQHTHTTSDIVDLVAGGTIQVSPIPLEMEKALVQSRMQYALTPQALTARISFIDDDAKAQVLTRVQPLIETKGIPWAIAVPATDIIMNAGRSLTQDELLHLQNDLGCELLGHTYSHPNLSTIPVSQLEKELGESKKILVSKGYNIRGIAYPFGANNAAVRKVAAKYYDWGVITQSKVNNYPLKSFQVDRVSLGSYTDGKNTLADYKAKVDEAVANKSWLIFVSHCWDAAHTDAQQQIISDLIDYIKSLNIPIVNPSDAWDLTGNLLEVEDKLRVTRLGEMIIDNSNEYKTIADSSRGADALINVYPLQTTIIAEYGNANRGSLPEAGMLETKRPTTKTDFQYSTQFLYGISGSIYSRKAISYNDATWGPWKIVLKTTAT